MSGAALLHWLVHRPVAVLLFAGLPVFLANYFAGHPGISGWDAQFYYAYAGAIADGATLDLERAYSELQLRGADPTVFDPQKRTPSGQVYNSYPLGHPLLHTPAAFLGSLIAIITEGGRNAFGPTAQLLYCLSALLGAALGIEAMRRTLLRHFPAGPLAISLYSLAGASMLGYYWFILPAHSHTSTLLVGGLTLALLCRLVESPESPRRLFAALGFLVAWAVMVRLQDLGAGLYALLVLAILVSAPVLTVGEKLQRAAALILTGLATFSIQLLHWRWKDGRWIPASYNDYSRFDFTQWNHLQVLFSPRHGLFLWHPILAIAACGFVIAVLSRSHARDSFTFVATALAGMFLSILGIGGFYSIWWFGDSFGSRPFLSVLPLFWIGLALLWERAESRSSRAALAVVTILLSLANGGLALAFHLGWISRSGPLF